MEFDIPLLPTREALKNPLSNLIRNVNRVEVERLFSMSRGAEDPQYKSLLRDRAVKLWRLTMYRSNQYATTHPELTDI